MREAREAAILIRYAGRCENRSLSEKKSRSRVQSFEGKIAVVTGGGTGMGRELVCQLISEGAHVATCDVINEHLMETLELAKKKGTGRLTTHMCDVSDENQQIRFRAEVAAQHETDHIIENML